MAGVPSNVKMTGEIGGSTFGMSIVKDTAGALVLSEEPYQAKAGTLSARTGNTTGTLTLSTGHGITTGDVVDLYWSGGFRYNVTVGTVSGNSVPLSDSGGGDNLPALNAAVTICKVKGLQADFDAARVQMLGIKSANRTIVTLHTDAPSVSLVREINPDGNPAGEKGGFLFNNDGIFSPWDDPGDVISSITVSSAKTGTIDVVADAVHIGIAYDADS